MRLDCLLITAAPRVMASLLSISARPVSLPAIFLANTTHHTAEAPDAWVLARIGRTNDVLFREIH
jgi:hypothetical protein